jgi:hypothetical protein
MSGKALLIASILASSVALSHGSLWSGGVAFAFSALVSEFQSIYPLGASSQNLSVLLEACASAAVVAVEVDHYAVLGLVLALACLGPSSRK